MADAALADNEEQVRELIARIQLDQQRMDALQQQANLVQMSLTDLDNALRSLATLEGKGEGQEILVPIGAGSFVFTRLASPDRVIIGLGAGVSVEKSYADSRGIIQSRKAELEKALLETSGAMERVAAELAGLQQEAQKYQ